MEQSFLEEVKQHNYIYYKKGILVGFFIGPIVISFVVVSWIFIELVW